MSETSDDDGAAGESGTPTADDGAQSSADSGDSDGTRPAGQPRRGNGGAGAGVQAPPPEPPPEVMEMLDPDVDWTALDLVFPVMYSAYDGVQTFQVPVRVDGLTVELEDWQAIPTGSVIFDADPENEGVIITVVEPEPEITIAVSTGEIGGTGQLFITEAAPEDWEVGKARYNNGVEYDIPMLNLLELFLGDFMLPPTPPDLSCTNCHTTGAKYLEILHTPTQIAFISDDVLKQIFLEGMKPEGIRYTVLPEGLEYLYPQFHTWEATDEEIRGLIVYLRSLTPEGMGELAVPDAIEVPEGLPMQ